MSVHSFFMKRHASLVVMTFFLFMLFPPFASSALCGENDDLQKLLNKVESEVSIERLLELIEELKKNKINLNEADSDELRQLPWLKSSDVQDILAWR